ncbi:MAG: hypothetical protein B5766_05080 [Candidatus Lumbricidophila eiseniae]|uniref:Enoyl reductase (ER) domain-containing protein n=1 Tax=Candidatus Lumbricidiphila eiseniae TaxID=1969409 RepID=A0A2A6FSC7_9MICO|nr:MAG: hypothetical protein B5766_05080 [Candidatus Lumbricidophila eiseniae]
MSAGTTMNALVYEAPELMLLRSVPRPVPGRGEVLVRVEYSGICGSELSGFLGHSSLRTAPLIFGHEFAGTVAECGEDVVGYAVGDRVTANPLSSCGTCEFCLAAHQELCPSRKLLGAMLPGSNAEYLVVAAVSLSTVPESLALSAASMAEPAACAVHAVTRSGIGPADTALVIGVGPIGMFLIQVLLAHGVTTVFVTDRNSERCRMAAALGALVIPDGEGFLSAVRERTDGRGVSIAFDAAGTRTTRRNCLAAVAPGGSVMLVGLHEDETSLPLNTVIRSEVSLHGVFAYTPTAFRTALAWLEAGRIGLAEGVVEVDLVDGAQWYRRLLEGDPALKVLLRPRTAACRVHHPTGYRQGSATPTSCSVPGAS